MILFVQSKLTVHIQVEISDRSIFDATLKLLVAEALVLSGERKVRAREVPLPVLRCSLELLQERAHVVQVLQIISRLAWLLLEYADVATAVVLYVAFGFELAGPQELKDYFVFCVVTQIE